MSIEQISLVAGILLVFVYDAGKLILKGGDWSAEAKDKIAMWLSLSGGAVVAFWSDEFTVEKTVTATFSIYGASQAYYKLLHDKIGTNKIVKMVSSPVAAVKEATMSSVEKVVNHRHPIIIWTEEIAKIKKDFDSGKINASDANKLAEEASKKYGAPGMPPGWPGAPV